LRDHDLTDRARRVWATLAPEESRAVGATVVSLKDPDVPLVGEDDYSVPHGMLVMGRLVRGTDLVVYYVPGPGIVAILDIVRRPLLRVL
jgi:hypothetical protein